MTTSKIFARRRDGYGFMIGRLLNIGTIHDREVYTIKLQDGSVVRLSGLDYDTPVPFVR